jgi:hypothetical protein
VKSSQPYPCYPCCNMSTLMPWNFQWQINQSFIFKLGVFAVVKMGRLWFSFPWKLISIWTFVITAFIVCIPTSIWSSDPPSALLVQSHL